MKDLGAFILEVKATERRLREPTDFWRAHQDPYFKTAQAIAARTLRTSRPPEITPEVWAHKSAVILNRIVGQLLAFGIGMEIAVTEPDGNTAAAPYRPLATGASQQDLARWIRAGMAGDPEGKRLTTRDTEIIRTQGIEALAYIVQRAYYSQRPKANYARLRNAIQRYLKLDDTTTGSVILDAIATAWEEHFTPRFGRDFSHHVGRVFGA